jgi:acetyl-CoA carboxylase carboxyl transferase subunit beta
MSWFEKLMPSRISTENRTKSVPEGVWIKCPTCDAQLYRNELERNLHVCPKCDFHMRIGARKRLGFFLDPDSLEELAGGLSSRRRKRPVRKMPWWLSKARFSVVLS